MKPLMIYNVAFENGHGHELLTLSNNVDTGIVSEGLESEEGTEALMKRDLARKVAKVSLEGLVSLSAGLGNGNVLKGHWNELGRGGDGSGARLRLRVICRKEGSNWVESNGKVRRAEGKRKSKNRQRPCKFKERCRCLDFFFFFFPFSAMRWRGKATNKHLLSDRMWSRDSIGVHVKIRSFFMSFFFRCGCCEFVLHE